MKLFAPVFSSLLPISPFAQSSVSVSVICVREFRAHGSDPVICHLDFEL
jgi:hypothetical protein